MTETGTLDDPANWGAADLPDCSDKELMHRHTHGDPDAFGELFRRHKDRMWGVALRTCGNPDLAADAVQDAFLSAFRRSDSYRGEAAVTTWLHRITVNACLDRLRRIKPTSELPEFDLTDGADAPRDVGIRLTVQEALAQLPEQQRAALVLVDMYAVPVAEAAQILEVAEGTVKSRCFRGRAALAQILAEKDPPATQEAAVEPDSAS